MKNNLTPSDARVIHLISNPKSGRGIGGTSLKDLAAQLCAELDARLLNYEISESHHFDEQVDRAIAAAKLEGGIIVAAGGDGTIRGIAQKVRGLSLKIAAVPCGTYNYFARNYSIPEDAEAALRLALTATSRPVQLGEVNGEVFLINASLGIYTKVIREREMRTSRFGRHRIVASISILLTFLEKHRLLDIDLVTDGEIRRVRTPMVFIGNNALQLRDLSLDVAHCMKIGLLAVVTMKKLNTLGMLKLLFQGVLSSLQTSSGLESFCARSISIYTRRTQLTVALDGELFQMKSPLNVKSLPQALNLILPSAVEQK